MKKLNIFAMDINSHRGNQNVTIYNNLRENKFTCLKVCFIDKLQKK